MPSPWMDGLEEQGESGQMCHNLEATQDTAGISVINKKSSGNFSI